MKYWLFLFCILSISCSKPNHAANEITKVELARSGAWYDHGAGLIIDSSLSYRYSDDNVKSGFFAGKINKGFWDTINRKLEDADFKTARSSLDMNVADASYFELIVYWKNKKRRVVRLGFGRKDSILKICFWLDTSYKKVDLHQINNPINFSGEFEKKDRPDVDHESAFSRWIKSRQK